MLAALNSDPVGVGIGFSYILLSPLGVLLNLSVIYAFYRTGLYRLSSGSGSVVFLLATCAMVEGICRMALFAAYCGPSIMLGRNLWEGEGSERFGRVSYHIAQLIFVFWEVGSLTELFIAFNRFFTIKHMCIDGVYTMGESDWLRRSCIFYAITVFPTVIGAHYLLDWATPCCSAYFAYDRYSLIYKIPQSSEPHGEGGEPHVVQNEMYKIMRAIAILCAVLSVSAYLAVFFMLYRARAGAKNLDADTKAKRRREVYHSLQFALAYVFYLALWLTFEMHSYLPENSVYLFSLEIYVAIVDCSTTALIQSRMNSRVRGELRKIAESLHLCSPKIDSSGGQGRSAVSKATTTTSSHQHRSSVGPV